MKLYNLMMIVPLLFSLLSGASTMAAGKDCSQKGITCVSGGIGSSEREELQQQTGQYNFWLRTVANKSGAYLADIKIIVRDEKTKSVLLSTAMDGPWLFLALPEGRFEVEAHYHDNVKRADQIIKKLTDIKKGSQRQMMMYFEASNVGELNYQPAQ
ncbi:hypothetical protein ACO0LC_00385 [Undibacterium sp. JH2W]|uniref:hypothetical protein n=1 Tax=Undibacterium sp. JH2W TaxID=3413037 RepID=UPI003BF303E1